MKKIENYIFMLSKKKTSHFYDNIIYRSFLTI